MLLVFVDYILFFASNLILLGRCVYVGPTVHARTTSARNCLLNFSSYNSRLQEVNFFISEKETIIINQVSDEIGSFYLSIIKHYADRKNIKINFHNDNETIRSENDLFGHNEIKILITNNTSFYLNNLLLCAASAPTMIAEIRSLL